jgi:hypothetical protein
MLGLLLVLSVATIIRIAWWHRENDRVTEENYDRLADGMTQAEVEAILGRPTAVERYKNEKLGRIVTWESRHTENHFVFARIISLSFDASGRKRISGRYTDAPVDIDSWLRFRQWVAQRSPWLAKHFF